MSTRFAMGETVTIEGQPTLWAIIGITAYKPTEYLVCKKEHHCFFCDGPSIRTVKENMLDNIPGSEPCIAPKALDVLDQGIGKKPFQENPGFSIEMFESDILPALRYAEQMFGFCEDLFKQFGPQSGLWQMPNAEKYKQLKKVIASIEAALQPPKQGRRWDDKKQRNTAQAAIGGIKKEKRRLT